jgi:hypothetical protein
MWDVINNDKELVLPVAHSCYTPHDAAKFLIKLPPGKVFHEINFKEDVKT